ncbi:MAG: hypothetical protein GF317_04290 [Candidatus Lokiarchaeota archaeon]|nr:hypothetical protein [Candidatus Lokiarchaeota archaeon]MBD3199108.1 hypothetical protein [Candidatus Lokiarchaeota archaeon]
MENATGIVFLFNMEEGTPEDVSKDFSDYFPSVTENLVRQGLLELAELKEIIDNKKVFWGAIKKNFDKVVEDTDAIGDLAWQVYKKHTKQDPSDNVRCLIYDGSQAPWNFTLMACVLYS